MKFLKKLDSMLEWVEEWILVITGTAVGLMILLNALFRFLRIDWFGSEELTLFVAFWLYFIGAACASRDGTHISADMLSLFTSNVKVRAAADIIKNIIAVGMCGTFTVWCFQYVSWQAGLGAKSVTYKLPVIIATIPILLCFALWTLYLIRDLCKAVRTLTGGGALETQTEGGSN